MTFKEYLVELGLLQEGAGKVEVVAGHVQDYLKKMGPYSKIDLSGVSVCGPTVVIRDTLFGSLEATNSDFNGIEIVNCEFIGSVSFEGTFVFGPFKMVRVHVDGDLTFPINLKNRENHEVVVSGLSVKGSIDNV